jgi:hypothetical protein
MLSPVIAQAILGQQAPDVAGQLFQGQEESRVRQARQLQGQALQKQLGTGELGQLAGKDPAAAAQMAKALGIPIGEEERLKSFAKDIQIASGLALTNPQEAIQFALQRRNKLNDLGIETPAINSFLEKISFDPDSAFDELDIINQGLEQAGLVDVAKGSKFQFGAQETFIDEAGNLFLGTTVRDPGTGATAPRLTPVSGTDKPVGKVQLASSLGQTAEQKQASEIAAARTKAGIEVSRAEQIETVKQRVKRGSEIRKELSTRNREAARSGRNLNQALRLAGRATQGLTGAVKVQLSRLIPGIDTSNEAALGASLDQLALDQLQAFKGPTTDFEFGVTRNIAGRLSDPRQANIARVKSLSRNAWFNQREFDQFDRHVKAGGDPDTFRFNFGQEVKTKKGVFTLQDIQETAVDNNLTVEETISELNK